MPATLDTITALATGLASVGAFLAYPLASSPPEGIAARDSSKPMRHNWLSRLFDGFSKKRTLAELSGLDDHILRDIGLTRGVLLSKDFRTTPRRSNLSEFDLPELRRH